MNYYFLLFQFFTVEIWKDIPGYDNKYQVSSFGRVMNMYRGVIIKPHYHPKGYEQLGFKHKGKYKCFRVHTLVANQFLVKELDHNQVNHITGIKTFNYWWALEWCTAKHNHDHAIDSGLLIYEYRKVYQYNLLGEYLGSFNSIKEVCEKFGYKDHQFRSCISSKHRYGGYIWTKKPNDNPMKYLRGKVKSFLIGQYDLQGNLIATHESINKNLYGFDGSCIRRCCRGGRKTAYGYQWKYI